MKNQTPADDAKDEIVGILTAISIVSKRLARKIAELEEENKEGEKHATAKQPTAGARRDDQTVTH